jgi:spermidine synthase
MLAASVYAFAVVSAVAALIYEISWTRLLALPFGRTTVAASAVVAGFMGGMGIGAWLYHRVARDGPGRALRAYAALELGIAVSTALLTLGFRRLPELFAGVADFLPPGLPMDLARVGFVFAALFVPTALMGATWPALCSVLIHSREGVARHLGRIYGLNTLGAAAGALLAGLVLIERLGLFGSVLCANALNVSLAGAALGLARRQASAGAPRALSETEARIPTRLPRALTGAVLFGSGFTTLAYEILWFRALQYLFGNSTYALTVMLVVFLLGLGLGGLCFGRVGRRPSPERDLTLCQLGIALAAVAAIAGEAALLANHGIAGRFSIFSPSMAELAWWKRLLTDGGLALAMMLPATLMMGL